MHEEVVRNTKLSIAGKLLPDGKLQTYLVQLPPSHRYAMARMRLGGHKLGVELGRYEKPYLERSQRFCRFCRSSRLVEDEVHILGQCFGNPELLTERETLATRLSALNSPELGSNCTIFTLSYVPTWDTLLNSQSTKIVELIGPYVYRCLKITHAKKWTRPL